MADEDARETVRWTFGVVKFSAPCSIGPCQRSPRSRKQVRAYVSQKLDTVLDAVDAAALEELLHRDRLSRVDEPAVDPVLEPVQVQRRHLFPQPVLKQSAAVW